MILNKRLTRIIFNVQFIFSFIATIVSITLISIREKNKCNITTEYNIIQFYYIDTITIIIFFIWIARINKINSCSDFQLYFIIIINLFNSLTFSLSYPMLMSNKFSTFTKIYNYPFTNSFWNEYPFDCYSNYYTLVNITSKLIILISYFYMALFVFSIFFLCCCGIKICYQKEQEQEQEPKHINPTGVQIQLVNYGTGQSNI